MRSLHWRFLSCIISVTASLLVFSVASAAIDTSGGWRLPFDGAKKITNGPLEGLHTGRSAEAIDYSIGASFAVVSPADGTVFDVINPNQYNTLGFGWVVRINHNGVYSFFAHLDGSNIFVQPGQAISQGQLIAMTGNSGNGEGMHLHYEARNGAIVNNVDSGNAVPVRATPGNWWNPWYSPPPNFQHDSNRPSGGGQYFENNTPPPVQNIDPNARHLSNQQSPLNVVAGWLSNIADNQITLHFGATPNTPNTAWATTFQVREAVGCSTCWQPVPGGLNITAPAYTENVGTWNQSEGNGQHTYLVYDYNQQAGQNTIGRFWDVWTGNSAQRTPHISAVYREGTDSTVLEYCAPSAVEYVVYEYHNGNMELTYDGPSCNILVHRNMSTDNLYSVMAYYSDGNWSPWTIWLIVHF